MSALSASAAESVTFKPAGPAAVPISMVERMTLILDEFTSPVLHLTLEDVAQRTHLPRSTAHRILDQLVRLQWLDHGAYGYSLGCRALSLGGGEGHLLRLREAAAPVLHALHHRTGLVVHLAVLDGAAVQYLDKVGGPGATSVPSRVGGRAPAHRTALGKAMLCWLPAEDVDLHFGQGVQTRDGVGGGLSATEVSALHMELNAVRRRSGLAFEHGECHARLGCVASAVRGPEGPVAALSLVGHADTPLTRVASLVSAGAAQVSRELFPRFRPPSQARMRGRRVLGRPVRPALVPAQSGTS